MTTLANLRVDVQERTGVSADDNAFSSTVLNSFINSAIKHVSTIHDWPWLVTNETITTAADDDEYAVPADYRKSLSVSYLANDLTLVTPKYATRFTQQTGTPAVWYSDQSFIYLYPVPDGVYSLTHRYIKTETALASDGDTPAIPTWADEVVVVRAAMYVATRMSDYELYRNLEREYRLLINDLRDDARTASPMPAVRTRVDALGGWA